MTPIQQAFAQWADEKYGPAPKGAPPQHERYATLFEAYAAGRDAGLGEAVEVCNTFYNHEAKDCASAIEQLKGKK